MHELIPDNIKSRIQLCSRAALVLDSSIWPPEQRSEGPSSSNYDSNPN